MRLKTTLIFNIKPTFLLAFRTLASLSSFHGKRTSSLFRQVFPLDYFDELTISKRDKLFDNKSKVGDFFVTSTCKQTRMFNPKTFRISQAVDLGHRESNLRIFSWFSNMILRYVKYQSFNLLYDKVVKIKRVRGSSNPSWILIQKGSEFPHQVENIEKFSLDFTRTIIKCHDRSPKMCDYSDRRFRRIFKETLI